MCQEAVRRLCNPSESCHVRKVARLLARPLRGGAKRVSKRSEFLLVLQTLVIVESQTRDDAFGVYRASVVMEDALRVDERSIPDDVGKAASEFFNSYRSGRLQPDLLPEN